MSRMLLPSALSAGLMGTSAMAEVPSVAVDIAPAHSLVARVMNGVGTPTLVMQPGASPHEYRLRPSEAAALQAADLVFWMGEDLTPWMADALKSLAANAAVSSLLEAEGTILLDFREGALFEGYGRGDEEHDERAEEDGHDEEHEEHEGDEEHEDGHVEHALESHGHSHGDHDPHAWLSPDNASTWLNLIAARLAEADPDNASSYFANAAAGREDLEDLYSEVRGLLDPVRGSSFIVFHDAYQYFETAFQFPSSGAISLSDATDPSPARIAEIKGWVREEGIDCVLAEPQFNPGIIATVLDGTDANTAVIDPLGADLEPGPTLYPQLIRNMAMTLAGCL